MKNFELYYNKLLDFSRLCGVSVYLFFDESGESSKYHNDLVDLGEFDPVKRSISVNANMPKSSQIAVFLHELGHFYDHMADPRRYASKKLIGAYSSYLLEKPISPKNLKIVVDCEKRAWHHGKAIARVLKIPLGRWYEKERQLGLSVFDSIPSKK